MDWGQAFSIANTTVLVCWLFLILLPRYAWLVFGLKQIVIASICVIYSVVIFLFISGVEGGGFGSLEQVKALFRSDAVVFAGWIHYLAFDLFVGMWIAERCDTMKLHRVFQACILVATFMLGPFGLLLYFAYEAGRTVFNRNDFARSSPS